MIEAELKGEITQVDFQSMKASIDAEMAGIEQERKALDREALTMESLIRQKDTQPVRLALVWQKAIFTQKIESEHSTRKVWCSL